MPHRMDTWAEDAGEGVIVSQIWEEGSLLKNVTVAENEHKHIYNPRRS